MFTDGELPLLFHLTSARGGITPNLAPGRPLQRWTAKLYTSRRTNIQKPTSTRAQESALKVALSNVWSTRDCGHPARAPRYSSGNSVTPRYGLDQATMTGGECPRGSNCWSAIVA